MFITQVYNLEDNWRVQHQDWTSLPGMFLHHSLTLSLSHSLTLLLTPAGMFLTNGFLSLGSGKTYHDTCQGELPDLIFEYDGARSWSEESLPYRNP